MDEILKRTIQIKVTKQHFPVVLACLFCCTRWFLLFILWMKSLSVTIQMKATDQYFPVVLFVMLYNVILTFDSVDEILIQDGSDF